MFGYRNYPWSFSSFLGHTPFIENYSSLFKSIDTIVRQTEEQIEELVGS